MATEPPTSAMAAEQAQAAERRASMQAFIEQKKYVQPGDGSLAPGYLGYNVSSPGGGVKTAAIEEEQEEEERRRRDEAVRRQMDERDGGPGGAKSDAVEGYLEKMAKEQERADKKKRGGVAGWLAAHMRRGSKDGATTQAADVR